MERDQIMGTTIAETNNAHRAWSNVMCQSTIEDVEVNVAEAVITVNANYPNAMAEVTSILRDHNATVRSGSRSTVCYGGVSSNGPEKWNKIVIRRVFPGLRGPNLAVWPRFPPELDV
jgi:hypothetical protein